MFNVISQLLTKQTFADTILRKQISYSSVNSKIWLNHMIGLSHEQFILLFSIIVPRLICPTHDLFFEE